MTQRNMSSHLKHKVMAPLLGVISLFILSSCQDITQAEKSNVRAAASSSSSSGDTYVYMSNPAVLRNNSNLTTPGFNGFLEKAFLTDAFYLTTPCKMVETDSFANQFTYGSEFDCFSVFQNNQAPAITKTNGNWNYPIGSDEFYQVNLYYHLKKEMDRFLDSMAFAHKTVHVDSAMYIPPATNYQLGYTQAFWLGSGGANVPLNAYSKCEYKDTDINAYFSPADDLLCMGWNENQPLLYMAQDPSVIYHEFGHVFVKIMMNQRNTLATNNPLAPFYSVDFKSDLGVMSYDEAGAINEGIADFFAYYMTNRAYIGEWAMDRIPYLISESQGYQGLKYGRPMSEDDPSHAAGISSDIPGEKLSYPEYINYNPHNPTQRNEGQIHFAGQIVSHYLQRLTTKFKDVCLMPTDEDQAHIKATNYTFVVLNETLAELGDMTAKGSDFFNEYAQGNALLNIFFTNLNADEAFLWGHQVTPPNMRKFFKLFAKNLKYHISYNLCPQFDVDTSEQLLDEYGLLLFKSYGDAGQGVYISNTGTVTDKGYDDYNAYSLLSNSLNASSNSSEVNELNRRETILVSKDYLDLPSDNSRATAYIFDGRTEIETILTNLTFEGKKVATSTNLAGANYNNDNIKISPGEIVGVSLNLVNNSNSTMSGVQILANDWDHMKMQDTSKKYVNRQENLSHSTYMNQIAVWEPCQINGWPKDTEGGVTWDENIAAVAGDCHFTSKTNKVMNVTTSGSDTYPYFEKDAPQPICLVQFSDENETKWVSQDYYRKYVLGLEDTECLNNEATGVEFNPNECLIRTLPGANQAVFGKIAPQKTWLETISENNTNPKHSASNIVLMEVNKWIQPGTTFNCRFRARFTNCQDCFNNDNSGEDYKDYEYIGKDPFKVINFSFKVID